MTHTLTGAEVLCVLKHFMAANAGDEATETLIISIGAEILDVSQDCMMELLHPMTSCMDGIPTVIQNNSPQCKGD